VTYAEAQQHAQTQHSKHAAMNIINEAAEPNTDASARDMEGEEAITEQVAASNQAFVCRLGKQLMIDPVVAADGYSYDRKNIAGWFVTHGAVSPVSKEPLDNTNLVSTHAIRDAIADALATARSRRGAAYLSSADTLSQVDLTTQRINEWRQNSAANSVTEGGC